MRSKRPPKASNINSLNTANVFCHVKKMVTRTRALMFASHSVTGAVKTATSLGFGEELGGSCDQGLGFHDGRELKCRSATLASGKRVRAVGSL